VVPTALDDLVLPGAVFDASLAGSSSLCACPAAAAVRSVLGG
jgi:hypothetical protein